RRGCRAKSGGVMAVTGRTDALQCLERISVRLIHSDAVMPPLPTGERSDRAPRKSAVADLSSITRAIRVRGSALSMDRNPLTPPLSPAGSPAGRGRRLLACDLIPT